MIHGFFKPVWIYFICLLIFPILSFSANSDIELGRKIYTEGVLPSGTVLKGIRGGEEFSGKQAACISCHRPSGMGSVEGDIQVLPITGNYLYRTGESLLNTMDPRSGKRFNQAHDPYTDDSLGVAIRHGINVSNKQMSTLMPRYDLKDDELRALIAYLKQLSKNYPPGVTKDEVHFATVISSDADPESRKILVNMLERGFKQKNGSTALSSRLGGRRHMVTAAEMVLGTERKWTLNIWDLKGPPDTWQKQLENYYRKEPVFALLSGVTGSTWQPVHDFCENAHVPCWFPSVDLPVDSDKGFYSIYFQRGVMLEASVLAKYLLEDPSRRPHRIFQIYHEDAIGNGASTALNEAFKNSGIEVINRPFSQMDSSALNPLMSDIGEQDVVMFWLNESDISLLDSIAVPNATIYLSGRLSGAEQTPLASGWKQVVQMIYPYELPERRQVNLNYFHRWARFNQIQIDNEPLQAEIYFSMEFLTETMSELLDNLYGDYLIERAETMLSRSQGSNAEVRDRTRQVLRWSTRMPRGTQQQEANVNASEAGKEKSLPGTNYADTPSKSTTIYPRMSLGVGQRFASKGAYIVHFDDVDSTKISPLSAWIIP